MKKLYQLVFTLLLSFSIVTIRSSEEADHKTPEEPNQQPSRMLDDAGEIMMAFMLKMGQVSILKVIENVRKNDEEAFINLKEDSANSIYNKYYKMYAFNDFMLWILSQQDKVIHSPGLRKLILSKCKDQDVIGTYPKFAPQAGWSTTSIVFCSLLSLGSGMVLKDAFMAKSDKSKKDVKKK